MRAGVSGRGNCECALSDRRGLGHFEGWQGWAVRSCLKRMSKVATMLEMRLREAADAIQSFHR